MVSWLSLLRTVRAPLSILLLAGAALLIHDQTRDMLTALGDGSLGKIGFTLAFHSTLAFLSVSAWYWSRTLLSARFNVGDTREARRNLVKRDPRVQLGPFQAVPRLIFGLALLLGVGLVFRSGRWIDLIYVAGWGIPFLLFVVFRLKIFESVRSRPGQVAVQSGSIDIVRKETSTPRFRDWVRAIPWRFCLLVDREPGSRWLAGLVILGALVAFFYGAVESFSVWPDGHEGLPAHVAAWFPGPAAALLALALMMAPLSALTFLIDGLRLDAKPRAWRVGLRRPPFMTLLVAWVLAASAIPCFHIHTVRIVSKSRPGMQISDRSDLEQFFKLWVQACAKADPIRPVVVALSGGASRAAYWGERVLYQVEHAAPGGRPVVFAVSSVSGGSLGAAAYAALVSGLDPEQRCGEDLSARTARIEALKSRSLVQDALGPLLAGALMVDIPRAFFSPAAKMAWYLSGAEPRGGDRAEAIERGFERLSRQLRSAPGATPDFSQPFLSLFYDENGIRRGMPIWIANGTDVATGSRLLTVPFAPKGAWPFKDAADVLSALNADVPISTAINNSARFPYLEPSGELLPHGIAQGAAKHPAALIIDGGYFENEGLLTALELAQWVQENAPRLAPGRTKQPIIVQATADSDVDVGVAQIERCDSPPDDPTSVPGKKRPLELLAPAIGLYKIRSAHSAVLLREARKSYCPGSFFHFYLPANGKKEVPLNWILSEDSASFIWFAMDEQAVSGNQDEAGKLRTALQ